MSHCDSLCNALLGALPGSPFIRHLVAALPENIRLHTAEREIHGVETISRATGPAFLTRVAAAFPRITAFPQPVLYPRASERPAAHARHHFAGSWRREWGQRSAPAAF